MTKNESIAQFSKWLETLDIGVKPSLKINNGFMNAAVVVDLGTPLEPVRLSQDDSAELTARMEELASLITNRRKIRVNFDNNAGIYWTSIA